MLMKIMNYRVTYNNGQPTIEQKVKKTFCGISYDGWQVTTTGKLQDAAQAFMDNINPKEFSYKHRIEPKFTIDGVTYYHFPDITNMPAMRYSTALTYIKESSMNCDREYLKGFVEAIYGYINNNTNTINIVEIVSRLRDLKERLEFAYVPDLVYKEASVLYFDESENPEDYDWEYNRRKIEKWKSLGDDFFLQTLAKGLAPSDAISQENSQTYMTILDMMDKKTTKDLFSSLSQTMSKEQLNNFSELRIRAEQQ